MATSFKPIFSLRLTTFRTISIKHLILSRHRSYTTLFLQTLQEIFSSLPLAWWIYGNTNLMARASFGSWATWSPLASWWTRRETRLEVWIRQHAALLASWSPKCPILSERLHRACISTPSSHNLSSCVWDILSRASFYSSRQILNLSVAGALQGLLTNQCGKSSEAFKTDIHIWSTELIYPEYVESCDNALEDFCDRY